MEGMHKLKDMLCYEIEELAKKGKLTAQDLDILYKLVVTKEKILRTEQIEGELGYSQDGGWMAKGTYSRSGYPMNPNYMRGESYGMNQYDSMSRGRYSMDDGRSMMGDRLSEMMNDPGLSQQERNVLRKAMESMR